MEPQLEQQASEPSRRKPNGTSVGVVGTAVGEADGAEVGAAPSLKKVRWRCVGTGVGVGEALARRRGGGQPAPRGPHHGHLTTMRCGLDAWE